MSTNLRNPDHPNFSGSVSRPLRSIGVKVGEEWSGGNQHATPSRAGVVWTSPYDEQ